MEIKIKEHAKYLRIHLTNVTGSGATQLLSSLIPALESNSAIRITEMHLPAEGNLAKYNISSRECLVKNYHRFLPKAASRIMECLLFSQKLKGITPLLVLGDLPLRCKTPQTILVQTSHLLKVKNISWSVSGFKFAISRWVFQLNLKYVNAVIVQSDLMKSQLVESYPEIAQKIHVISLPVPSWLLGMKVTRKNISNRRLKLIYPADNYLHKNHKLLSRIVSEGSHLWAVEKLMITLPQEKNPAPDISWIDCVGFLSTTEMIKAYQEVDGLLFLSTKESYGFPLVEAMYMGVPIVCPDLPYARFLCADVAIYFNPDSIDSLNSAIGILHKKLVSGWRPDWSCQLRKIPKDWNVVAEAFVDVACNISYQNFISKSKNFNSI